MTSRTHDEGFHEIQLSGKQLVFLFMAASVVAGVIFLLGVFVGRGVRVERGTTAQAAALNEAPVPDIARISPAPREVGPSASDPTAAAPPTPAACDWRGRSRESRIWYDVWWPPAAFRVFVITHG